MPYAVLILGTVLAFFGYAYSKAIGFGITVLCAAATSYFLMTPVRSLRVSETEDLLALSAYFIVSAVVLPFRRSGRRTPVGDVPATSTVTPVSGSHSDLSAAFAELSVCSELNERLRATHIDVGTGLTIRCLPREASRILSDLFRVALDDTDVSRFSLDVCRLPGRDLLFLTAHRVWPLPLCKTLTIGKREEDCGPIPFPAWPDGWRATQFDNGYAHIYQISIAAARSEGVAV